MRRASNRAASSKSSAPFEADYAPKSKRASEKTQGRSQLDVERSAFHRLTCSFYEHFGLSNVKRVMEMAKFEEGSPNCPLNFKVEEELHSVALIHPSDKPSAVYSPQTLDANASIMFCELSINLLCIESETRPVVPPGTNHL